MKPKKAVPKIKGLVSLDVFRRKKCYLFLVLTPKINIKEDNHVDLKNYIRPVDEEYWGFGA